LIDLHLHTTASDGRLAPSDLVELASASGLTIISVTDHDTTAGLEEAGAAADRLGVRLIDGIEITAVETGRDVHLLGYFFDPTNAGLAALEARHSQQDVAAEMRYRQMASRLDLVVSGGFDFHADPSHRIGELGLVTLPPADFAALEARASSLRRSGDPSISLT